MVNFVETLFGLTALTFVIAIVLFFRGNRPRARRVAFWGCIVGVLAVAGEIYLQLFL
jgi:hypothetical protein